MRFESRSCRACTCQIFFNRIGSSGHFDGRARMVMLAGMSNLADRCHPARSTRSDDVGSTGATALAISARCRFISFGIAEGQDQSRALALFRADGTEDIGRCGSLIPRRARASAALGPPAGDLVLLADTSLVLEPNFYLADVDCFFARGLYPGALGSFFKILDGSLGFVHDGGVVPSLR